MLYPGHKKYRGGHYILVFYNSFLIQTLILIPQPKSFSMHWPVVTQGQGLMWAPNMQLAPWETNMCLIPLRDSFELIRLYDVSYVIHLKRPTMKRTTEVEL